MSRGKPSPTLPPLPLEAIRAEGRQWVKDQLAGIQDAEKIIEVTTAIITDQQGPFERARKRRDETAISIREYGPDATEAIPRAVRNVRLAEATGVSRPRLQVLRQQWPAGVPVKLVRNAREVLPKHARAAALHQARIDYAIERRDDAITQLIRAGWSNVEISRLMDRDPSRAAHLRKRVLEAS